MNDYPQKGLHVDNRIRFKPDTKPTHSYGTLPNSMDEARSVTTDATPGPFRSVGVVGNQIYNNIQPLSLSGMNTSTMPPPSLSRGLQYGTSKPKYVPEEIVDSFCDSLSPFDSFCEPKSESKHLSSQMWNVNDHNLKPKPDFYPLEQTATFVPHSKPSTVASRVASFLLERNISVTFNELKAKAKCVSKDDVEFNVRLYKGKNQFDHGVIVEVQRRYGFSVFYHRDAVGILDAAAGKPTMEPLEEPSFCNHEAENFALTRLIY